MKDFLRRMARRARGEINLVEPRLPSIFQPPDRDEVIESGEPVVPAAGISRSVTQVEEMQSGFEIEGRQEKIRKTKRLSEVKHVVEQPLLKIPREDNFAKRDIVTEPGRRDASKSSKKVFEKEQPFIATVSSDDHHEMQLKLPADRRKNEVEHQTDLSRQPTVLVQDYIGSGKLDPVPAAVVPGTMEVEKSQEPTVHIHIGRIEVRGQRSESAARTSPPPPVRTKSTQPRKLSLNDYLKQSGSKS